MSQINLLPWREESREQLKRDYFGRLGFAVVVSLLVVVAWVSFASSALDQQVERNNYLQSNIDQMDKQVAEIRELKNKKQEMISRMRVIQDLQGNRSEIVKLFDQLVRAVPDGVYLYELDRQGAGVKMTGFAESNNRISMLMRNLDQSPKYRDSNLAKVEQDATLGNQGSKFDLQVGIEIQSPADELVKP